MGVASTRPGYLCLIDPPSSVSLGDGLICEPDKDTANKQRKVGLGVASNLRAVGRWS
jgi:hypothetical protein